MRKVGVLMSVAENDPDTRLRIAAFRQGLRDLGWVDGENIRLDYRWGAGRLDLIQQYAQELVALMPDLIVANDVSQAGSGFDVDTNAVTIIGADGEQELPQQSKSLVAEAILDRVEQILRSRVPTPPRA